MKLSLLLPALLLPIALAPACGDDGGSDTETDDDDDDDDTGDDDDDLGDMDWVDVPDDQRQMWMAMNVLPEMTELFQGHDADRFGDFTCMTCHSEAAMDLGFKMPAAPALPADNPGSPDPELAMFMASEVLPRMTEILGKEPFNPDTGEGFGCFACHKME